MRAFREESCKPGVENVTKTDILRLSAACIAQNIQKLLQEAFYYNFSGIFIPRLFVVFVQIFAIHPFIESDFSFSSFAVNRIIVSW